MRKTVLLASVWVVAFALIIINILINPGSFFTNGTLIVGWLFFSFQLTWSQSERFYMQLKSIWFFVKNPDCIWNMQVELCGNFHYEMLGKIDSFFLSKYEEIKITKLSNCRVLYKINTLAFEIVIEENQIRFTIDDLEVSYRRSRTIIQKEIGGLLEGLSRIAKEDSSDYYLNINFKEYNPYFGFFVRRLNANEINTFNVKFNIDNEKVSINKKSIELHTDSLSKLTDLSKEYLSLSPR
ncbi:hypothetical protein [Siminovitchia fordii]|uniref:hypothetical protein n=1 Tax=Siminovitchia fordii TaxID=254759 RepID=UPI0003711C6B|nr:hypothetical protein [Siminovitchia fordii]